MKAKTEGQPSPANRFYSLTKRLLAVPKAEADKQKQTGAEKPRKTEAERKDART